MIRHVLRQFAVQTLYQMEVGQMTKEEAIENIEWMVEGLKEEAMEVMAEEVTPHQILEVERQFTLDEFYFQLHVYYINTAAFEAALVFWLGL